MDMEYPPIQFCEEADGRKYLSRKDLDDNQEVAQYYLRNKQYFRHDPMTDRYYANFDHYWPAPDDTNGVHVTPSGKLWSVRWSGNKRASGRFTTVDEATRRAETLARGKGACLFVHDEGGRIRRRYRPA